MEQRRQKRINVGYKAELSYSGKVYDCVIENLSATGAYIITSPVEADFKPLEAAELMFDACPGETVILKCRIMWARKTLPHRLTSRIGLEIVDPSWDRSDCFV
ncbi:MAG: PilZ domain-containing protein [Nitrospirae bacterium]|nr:PilZ domain-containing protein [Nitrospirota bacterium]